MNWINLHMVCSNLQLSQSYGTHPTSTCGISLNWSNQTYHTSGMCGCVGARVCVVCVREKEYPAKEWR
jgi:hypothetical protein